MDAPGDALPIHLIAEDLRLSATPVREALSRLAGEDLVEKRGPTYTRPRLDGRALAELYNLRLVYLAAAMASRGERGGTRRRPPPQPSPQPSQAFAEALARTDPALVVEALLLEIVLAADDRTLAQIYYRAAARLAPFQAAEAQVLADGIEEARVLAAAFEIQDAAALRAAVRQYHRRRIRDAEMISRLAGGAKYRLDMI